MVFIVTPWIRPLTPFQIVFTYLVPILPMIIAWDGMVSNARTYTKSDLEELTKDFRADDHVWECHSLRAGRGPGKLLYLMGAPMASGTAF